jgi:hypothetical protein
VATWAALLSFAAALHIGDLLKVAIPLYGTPAREMPWIEAEKISIPVKYHSGMLDAIYGFGDPDLARHLMDQAGCNVKALALSRYTSWLPERAH